ncbi:MAG: YaiI/YqxD family protein [Candidatus Omnitrophica bacterium]|nr:YaiI/YqxD family protein [Candidatus Omnitrophota bacterium]
MFEIYVDADACPVKQEVIKVAERFECHVTFVANAAMRIPESQRSKLVVVESRQLDAADDWIVNHLSRDDLVITTDIPLAYRCVQAGAAALDSSGHIFTEENVGQLLAQRDLMSSLRDTGMVTGGGPAPFQKQDRSRFLHSLDQMIRNRARQ